MIAGEALCSQTLSTMLEAAKVAEGISEGKKRGFSPLPELFRTLLLQSMQFRRKKKKKKTTTTGQIREKTLVILAKLFEYQLRKSLSVKLLLLTAEKCGGRQAGVSEEVLEQHQLCHTSQSMKEDKRSSSSNLQRFLALPVIITYKCTRRKPYYTPLDWLLI